MANERSLTDLADAARTLDSFSGGSLRKRIAAIERDLRSSGGTDCQTDLASHQIGTNVLVAAYLFKEAASQIHEMIHALGILLLLPGLLEEGETVDYLSLAAGNTGKPFDLETDRRVAEFKFIRWRGRDSVRQSGLFKDFFYLAEHETSKAKFLYVTGADRPLRFLRSRRTITSVCQNPSLRADFTAKYGDRFRTVADYFATQQSPVTVEDVEPRLARLGIAPGLMGSPTPGDAVPAASNSTPAAKVQNRYAVLGHPATAVIRWMGAHGWSFGRCKTALVAVGAGVADATIRTQLRAGRKGLRGATASLTPEQAAVLEAAANSG